MTNAKEELIKHVAERDVQLVRIVFGRSYGSEKKKTIEGSIDDVLLKLDFEYDSGFGAQMLFGFIWYTDGTWSERGEYDGSEWWEYMARPPLHVTIGA